MLGEAGSFSEPAGAEPGIPHHPCQWRIRTAWVAREDRDGVLFMYEGRERYCITCDGRQAVPSRRFPARALATAPESVISSVPNLEATLRRLAERPYHIAWTLLDQLARRADRFPTPLGGKASQGFGGDTPADPGGQLGIVECRFSPLRTALEKAGFPAFEVMDVAWTLCRAGHLTLVLRNRRRDRYDWEIAGIRLSRQQHLAAGRVSGYTPRAERLARSLQALEGALARVPAEEPAAAEIAWVLREQRDGLMAGQTARLAGVAAAAPAYPALVRALEGIALVLAAGERPAERELSVRLFDDSKALARLKPKLEQVLGCRLAELGIGEHLQVIWMSGPVTWRLGGNFAKADAFFPAAALPLEMLEEMEELYCDARAILIVENMTPFLEGIRREWLKDCPLVLVHAGGFPAPATLAFLERLAHSGSFGSPATGQGRPLYGWFDLDYGGIQIFETYSRWAHAQGFSFRPAGMEESLLAATRSRRHLTEASRKGLDAYAKAPDSQLAPLAQAILKRDAGVEQEAILKEGWQAVLRMIGPNLSLRNL